jgi:protein phosphatase methylesterase 1
MSELQRKWAKAKLNAMADLHEAGKEGEHGDVIPELPEFPDDDSSSASSASSTGTIIPSPSQKLFARPQG